MKNEQSNLWSSLININVVKQFQWKDEFIYLEDINLLRALPPCIQITSPIGIFLEKGWVQAKINLKPIMIKAPCLVVLREGEYVEITDFQPDVLAKAIFFSPSFTQLLNLKPNYMLMNAISQRPVVRLSSKARQILLLYCEMMKAVLESGTPYVSETAINLTRALIFGIGHNFYLRSAIQKNISRQEATVKRFVELVQNHCKEERSVEFYADKLHTTAKYLSTMVHKSTQKPPSKWISEYVTLEAKVMLTTTDLTVSEISEALHFPDSSFFCKYFKRECGVSPKEFRQQSHP